MLYCVFNVSAIYGDEMTSFKNEMTRYEIKQKVTLANGMTEYVKFGDESHEHIAIDFATRVCQNSGVPKDDIFIQRVTYTEINW